MTTSCLGRGSFYVMAMPHPPLSLQLDVLGQRGNQIPNHEPGTEGPASSWGFMRVSPVLGLWEQQVLGANLMGLDDQLSGSGGISHGV